MDREKPVTDGLIDVHTHETRNNNSSKQTNKQSTKRETRKGADMQKREKSSNNIGKIKCTDRDKQHRIALCFSLSILYLCWSGIQLFC